MFLDEGRLSFAVREPLEARLSESLSVSHLQHTVSHELGEERWPELLQRVGLHAVTGRSVNQTSQILLHHRGALCRVTAILLKYRDRIKS